MKLEVQKERYAVRLYEWIYDQKPSTQFTAEEIREAVGNPPGHRNSMGALVGGLVKRQLIKSVGRRRARRPSGHSCWLDLYQVNVPKD